MTRIIWTFLRRFFAVSESWNSWINVKECTRFNYIYSKTANHVKYAISVLKQDRFVINNLQMHFIVTLCDEIVWQTRCPVIFVQSDKWLITLVLTAWPTVSRLVRWKIVMWTVSVIRLDKPTDLNCCIYL